VLRMGLVAFTVASLLCAVAPTGWILVAGRCLQGIGAAFLVPSSLAMINARFTGARQAGAIGTWTAWTGTAFVVGPPLGGLLVDALSWRWVFGINAVPLAVTLYLTTRLGTENSGGARRSARIDVVGAVLCAAGLTAAVYALIELQRLGPTHPAVITGFVLGVGCLAAFPWWERRTPNPIMPLQLFAARNFAVGNLATVFLYAAVSLGTLIVALFLQETVGLSASQAGLATLPLPVLSFFLARPFGTLAGRHGPRVYMAIGPIIAAGGFLLLTTARAPFDFWTQMLPGLVVFGVGLSITVSPLTAAVLAAVDPAQSGIGSAVNNAVSRVAGLIAVAFAGVIVGTAIDFAGFRSGAVVVAVLFAAAGVVSAIGISNRQCDFGRISLEASAQSHDRATPPPALAASD
jgi:MFS family permease